MEIEHTPSQEEEYARQQAWLISFADLLSVILTFFILFYSMSGVPYKHWFSATQSKGKQADGAAPSEKNAPLNPRAFSAIKAKNALDLGYLYHIIAEKLQTPD